MENSSEELRELCIKIRNRLRPDVVRLKDYVWFGALEPKFYDVMKRAMIIRQWEACEAIQALSEVGHGAMCCTLLRPAYEELLWLHYLEKHKGIASRLAIVLARKEISDSYKAQKGYLGDQGVKRIGFQKKKMRSLEEMRKPTYKELREIGEQLGWKEGQVIPSVAHIAKEVGKEREYNYLYQGTSRSVHFSVHELQRRVWGEHGNVRIGSNTFKNYWADFGAYWSTKILLETIIFSGHADNLSKLPEVEMEKFLTDLNNLRAVQILTSAELETWTVPSPQKEKSIRKLS